MKKLDHTLLDLFFILASLEGLAAVGYLISIPGDPKNSILLGLSMQRLLLVAAMAGTALLLRVICILTAVSHWYGLFDSFS